MLPSLPDSADATLMTMWSSLAIKLYKKYHSISVHCYCVLTKCMPSWSTAITYPNYHQQTHSPRLREIREVWATIISFSSQTQQSEHQPIRLQQTNERSIKNNCIVLANTNLDQTGGLWSRAHSPSVLASHWEYASGQDNILTYV